MGKKLARIVHVTDPETFERHVFGPDDDVPKWAAAMITNSKAWADETQDEDAGEKEEPPPPPPAPATDGGGDGQEGARPPGNASRADWAAYALSLDPPINVTGEMKRDDIIAAVDKAQQANQDA
jgi:hypothetical protein